ncbi:hypothetical protein [Burkholderia sp. BCC0044]|uniref:hypothetical protein n=1 Tax=Burkholderia sp. BCC0044 TaxID=2676295 RepID=UPI00158D6ADD|nr:hypothetical protein [Burkholderia sp. BCC0044]
MRKICLLKISITTLLFAILAEGTLAASESTIKLCQDADCVVPLASEPYQWVTLDGRVLIAGIADENGDARVISESNVKKYALETVNRRWEYYVESRCWAGEFQNCIKMTDARNIDGFYDLKSHKKSEEKAKIEEYKRKRIEQALLSAYKEAADKNDDPLAWLGPLPKEWRRGDVRDRLEKLTDQISKDVTAFIESGDPFASFRCETPAEFGAVPDEAAVRRFMTEFGKGKVSDATWDSVMLAAKKGNWQARWFVYAYYRDFIRHNDSLVLSYRLLQLKEWLVSHQVGPIYFEFSNALDATGIRGGPSGYISPATLLAAHRGSYTAMSQVGHSLENDESPDVKRLGKAMIDCASSMVPKGMR